MNTKERPDAAAPPVTVLLAEDEFLIRLAIADELRHGGWHVIEVGTADEGADVIRSAMPLDLVITDVHMPGERNGLELARLVRAVRPGTPVVVMSGQLAPTAADADLYTMFIPKPASDLFARISALLGQRAAPESR
ncbi:MAG TPA: response regulator [Devosiaceae bacterium]|nr:response regulator [Devosiaceae bacterium]